MNTLLITRDGIKLYSFPHVRASIDKSNGYRVVDSLWIASLYNYYILNNDILKLFKKQMLLVAYVTKNSIDDKFSYMEIHL
jgi:hypothetical protein